MRDLYIYGAGGFGRETAWLVERVNRMEPQWDLKGFLDDEESLWGTREDGYEILGGAEFLKTRRDAWVVCAVGSAKIRRKVIENLEGVRFATLIDPAVIRSGRVSIGEGTILCGGTILTVDVSVGKHCIINLDCTIGHDVVLKDFVTLYPGVHVSGHTEIEECCEIGTGTQIIQGKRIGKGSIVGAGAVVIRDIPEGCTAVGNPARAINFY